MASVVEVTRETFHDVVKSGERVLVDLWGPECQPCLQLSPHVEQLAERYPDVQVVKLEAPKARRICIEHQVMTLPSFILFENGEAVARTSSRTLTADELESWLTGQLGETRKDANE